MNREQHTPWAPAFPCLRKTPEQSPAPARSAGSLPVLLGTESGQRRRYYRWKSPAVWS